MDRTTVSKTGHSSLIENTTINMRVPSLESKNDELKEWVDNNGERIGQCHDVGQPVFRTRITIVPYAGLGYTRFDQRSSTRFTQTAIRLNAGLKVRARLTRSPDNPQFFAGGSRRLFSSTDVNLSGGTPDYQDGAQAGISTAF